MLMQNDMAIAAMRSKS